MPDSVRIGVRSTGLGSGLCSDWLNIMFQLFPACLYQLWMISDEINWPEPVRTSSIGSASARLMPDWIGGVICTLQYFFGLKSSLCELFSCFLPQFLRNCRGIKWSDPFLIGSACARLGPDRIGSVFGTPQYFFGLGSSLCQLFSSFSHQFLRNAHGMKWPDPFLIGSASARMARQRVRNTSIFFLDLNLFYSPHTFCIHFPINSDEIPWPNPFPAGSGPSSDSLHIFLCLNFPYMNCLHIFLPLFFILCDGIHWPKARHIGPTHGPVTKFWQMTCDFCDTCVANLSPCHWWCGRGVCQSQWQPSLPSLPSTLHQCHHTLWQTCFAHCGTQWACILHPFLLFPSNILMESACYKYIILNRIVKMWLLQWYQWYPSSSILYFLWHQKMQMTLIYYPVQLPETVLMDIVAHNMMCICHLTPIWWLEWR